MTVAVAMAVVDRGNSGCCRRRQQGTRVTWARVDKGAKARERPART